MSFKVPFIRPVFPRSTVIGEDFDAIVESNWFTNFGPMERRFSAGIAEYIGGENYSVTFTNATIALVAVLQEALGRGDDRSFVIVPSFTFAAGPEAVEWAGYRPVFVDIDPVTLQPSIDEARTLIEDGLNIAGILLCNTFGIGNPRIAEWETLASQAGLKLIIDSAAGFGSEYSSERRVGSAGLAEVFSFHATKPFAVGEGGAVVTRDAELVSRLISFQNFGFSGGRGAHRLGLNGKLQEINAAIGLRQLAGFDTAIKSRHAVLAGYQRALADSGVSFPAAIELSSVCFATILLSTSDARDGALARLLSAGVEARAYYAPALH
jgi:dTDP-4-amino-4,6-dideoxygalactose transaminase